MDAGDAEIAHNIRAPTPRLAVPSARPRPEVDRPPVTELKAASAAGGHDNSSNSVFASFRSGASKPSVNQCRSGRAGLLRCACPVSARAGPEGGAQFEEGALCRRAAESARSTRPHRCIRRLARRLTRARLRQPVSRYPGSVICPAAEAERLALAGRPFCHTPAHDVPTAYRGSRCPRRPRGWVRVARSVTTPPARQ